MILPEPAYAGKYARVLVAVHDRADLRAAVVPHAVRAPVVAVWVAALPSSPGFVPRPEWPPMKAFRTQPVGDGYLVVARFEQPVRAANVVRELGRQSVWAGSGDCGGPGRGRRVRPRRGRRGARRPAGRGAATDRSVDGARRDRAGADRGRTFPRRTVRRAGPQPDRLPGRRRRAGGDARLARQRRAHREPRAIAASVARCPRRRPRRRLRRSRGGAGHGRRAAVGGHRGTRRRHSAGPGGGRGDHRPGRPRRPAVSRGAQRGAAARRAAGVLHGGLEATARPAWPAYAWRANRR